MSNNCLLVQGISPSVSLTVLKQIFEFYGPCLIEPKGENAFIQYKNPESYQNAMQNLNNTNLLGHNQKNILIQMFDLLALSQQIQASKNLINPNSTTSGNQPTGSLGKSSFGSMNQAENNMSFERKGNSSPFQTSSMANTFDQNKKSIQVSMNSTIGSTNKNFGNYQSQSQIANRNDPFKEKENNNQPIQIFSGKQLEHDYLKSQAIPNSKISQLVQLYQSNKLSSTNEGIKIYSNQEEFWREVNSKPKGKESQNVYQTKKTLHQNVVDYDRYTITELTAELKKRGINISGTRQTLQTALERYNENLF